MGMESFWLTLRNVPREKLSIIEHYSGFFDVKEDAAHGEICLEGALVCFLPACRMLFAAYQALREAVPEMQAETRGELLPSDIADELQFCMKMFAIWQEKLEHFDSQFGTFYLRPSEYYGMRKKIEKHCIRLSERI